jgi:archaellum component FlaF (FlaF/FlaG flagellin family)
MKQFFRSLSIVDVLVSALVLIFIVFVASTDLRTSLQAKLNKPFRRVLAVASAQFSGTPMKVVKVQSQEGISLEVYQASDPSRTPLVDQILLPDRFDAYFKFRGEALNLAVDDTNGDSHLEIIAPTFDEARRSRLHIFQFNPEIKKFEALR